MPLTYTRKKALVIDDEPQMREMLTLFLQSSGYTAETVANGLEALQKLKDSQDTESPFNLILCDIKMPVMDGLEFLAKSKGKLFPATVIMMSGYEDTGAIVKAMKLGAEDYIDKPLDIEKLLMVLEKADKLNKLKNENMFLKKHLDKIDCEVGLEELTRSPAMHEVYQMVLKAAKFPITVLVNGESGTGKELIAKNIHFRSDRSDKPLVCVNCGSIPETLMESEFFGYKKGSFTDAKQDRTGLFEEANGGTIFLDEIGELPLSMQVKLLRVLQEGEIKPVGDANTRKIDVRIIAATARNLHEEVEKGSFRNDLFYRINALTIMIPPLRDRREDIPALSEQFLKRHSNRLGRKINSISPESIDLLLKYSWPGNIRELENVIERAIVLAHGDVLQTKDLPLNVLNCSGIEKDSYIGKNKQACQQNLNSFSLKKAKIELEIKMIANALQATNGNRTHASRLLEISHPSLLSKIKEFGIDK